MRILTSLFIILLIFTTVANAAWNGLHDAVNVNDEQRVRIILSRPDLSQEQKILIANEQACDGKTPLHVAALRDAESIAILLLREYRATQNIPDFVGYLPIHYAAKEGWISMAKLLFRYGATPNDLTEYNETPLIVALMHHQWQAADFFIEAGTNVNIQAVEGRTALHYIYFIKRRYKIIHDYFVHRLLQHGADITIRHEELEPPEFYEPALRTFKNLYDQAWQIAHNELFALACCLHKRLGAHSAARSLALNLIEEIYRMKKQLYFEEIEQTSMMDPTSLLTSRAGNVPSSDNSLRFIARCCTIV